MFISNRLASKSVKVAPLLPFFACFLFALYAEIAT